MAGIASTLVSIRPAEAHDFEAVTALLEELGRPAVPPDDAAAARAVFLRHVAREDTGSLVAEVDGVVMGFMSLEFRERLNHKAPQAWIPDLIVTEAARGVGAGRALLAAGIALAKERGCNNITLESGYQRKVAHQLYGGTGLKKLGYFFQMPL